MAASSTHRHTDELTTLIVFETNSATHMSEDLHGVHLGTMSMG